MRAHFLFRMNLLSIPLFLFATAQLSAQSGWRQIGKAGEWSNTVMLRTMNGVLYSIEDDGTLYATTLSGSSYSSYIIGKPESYDGTRLFATMDGMIYNVQGGTLYETDAKTGLWREVSKGWNYTTALACMNGYIWSLEQDGTLFRSDLNGSYVKIGETDGLPNVHFMAAMGGKLYAMQDGTMYVLDPAGGSWEMFGDQDEFWDAEYVFATRSYLWVLFDNGELERIDASGKYTLIGKNYSNITLLAVIGDAVYAVKDGTLYKTR